MPETFHIVPATSRMLWVVMALLLIVLLTVATIFTLSIRGAHATRFELSSAGLRIRGDLYGRMIAAADLDGSQARRLNLEAEPALRPRMRTFGTAVPGYRSGWFRLRSGEKALLYLTDASSAVYVPTRKGYSLMLSVAEPDRFLTRIRELSGNSNPPRS